MNDASAGLLLVWTNIPEELEADFNEWYNREHMRERIALPGFTRGRRCIAYDGAPRYLALYETRGADVLHSEAYLALKRKFDANSLRFVPHFRDTLKTAAIIVAESRIAEGGHIALIPLSRANGSSDRLRESMRDELLPALTAKRGVVAAWCAQSDEETLSRVLADVPRTSDRILDCVLAIEATSQDDLAAAVASVDWHSIRSQGAEPDEPLAQFSVVYTLRSPD